MHESINAGGKNTSSTTAKVNGSVIATIDKSTDVNPIRWATKDSLQAKTLGADGYKSNSISLTPKINKSVPRIPTNYLWKENVKNGKVVEDSEMKTDRLENQCVQISRTSSTKR